MANENGDFHVSSEIYTETNFRSQTGVNGHSISKFTFLWPEESAKAHSKKDKDGDLVVVRRRKSCLELEHSQSTNLKLVGLQVWRGALLLADYILHQRDYFRKKTVLEVGSGCGLTSIVASTYAKRVICTDISEGGILSVISRNVQRNVRKNIQVLELDFLQPEVWKETLKSDQDAGIDYVLAADVIYDDDITDAFIATLDHLLSHSNYPMKVLIALEKRYVFTVTDLDTTAPCFEHFLKHFEELRYSRGWRMEYIPMRTIPQYFTYERVPQLILIQITKVPI
ncbi:methyltransferase-like protein 22 [Phlebotomus argentipes]|uniref:methyltransferase-like protein 22 n=1 Tax=Phlebotomus argentipes TaxID=94469 RepID=UPI0028932968|nr:methyltransferase-like protein 22 [Phlebotomus argentipes]